DDEIACVRGEDDVAAVRADLRIAALIVRLGAVRRNAYPRRLIERAIADIDVVAIVRREKWLYADIRVVRIKRRARGEGDDRAVGAQANLWANVHMQQVGQRYRTAAAGTLGAIRRDAHAGRCLSSQVADEDIGRAIGIAGDEITRARRECDDLSIAAVY